MSCINIMYRVVQMGFCQIRLSFIFDLSTREPPDTATIARNGRFRMSTYQKCPETLSNSHWASRTSRSKTVEKPEIPEILMDLISSDRDVLHFCSNRKSCEIWCTEFCVSFSVSIFELPRNPLLGTTNKTLLLLPKMICIRKYHIFHWKTWFGI